MAEKTVQAAENGPVPQIWNQYMREVYWGRKGPETLGTVSFEDIEEKAKEKLKDYPGVFMYAGGNAGTGSTYRANLKAFQRYRIIPRMLVDTTVRNLEATILGVRYPSPLLIAPIGVQGIFSAEGELAPARAAQKLGIPFILSTVSSRSMDQVAQENGSGHRWYQLYWPKSQDVTVSLLRRAKANGFSAVVITLDTMALGWRPHDIDISYMPHIHGVGMECGRSDPVFMAKFGLQPIFDQHPEFPYDFRARDKLISEGDPKALEESKLGNAWLAEVCSGQFHSWDDLKLIRDNWDGPIVLKGIQRRSDAEKALEFGVNGIIVSNHGGRQVDGAIPSLYALAEIMASDKIKQAQKAGNLTVLFDSGIRTGSDIIKAMALGAQGVLLGRLFLYGAILAGQAGVEQVIKHTMADLDTTLGLSGYASLDQIQGIGEELVKKIDFEA
ncbi:oxidoreductase [Desarmillaria tabescens]|uniref:Oxidoreductase n=1 Tax=Armillaria tabescens TaxID=1929756 RepID=A0AA39KFD9_ARMTA|nr:oxidoreductase [Desarmillaria tabescens]KAK0460002.1 oxidoreductase [Desarmillaria tabescens]